MAGLKIGALARLSGMTVKAIRFYEAKGLLPRPARSPSGYRLYAFLVKMRRAKRARPNGRCACIAE